MTTQAPVPRAPAPIAPATAQNGNQAVPLSKGPSLEGFRALSDADVAPVRAIVAAVSGFDKTGKTAWGLVTGPGDAYLLAMDANSIPTAHKVQRELRAEWGSGARQIHINDFTFQRGIGYKEGVERWARYRDSYYGALSVGKGTLVVDTETIMYQMAQLAFVGTEGRVQMSQGERMDRFGALNAEYLGMLAAARRSGMSVLFIQKLAKTYVKTGNSNQSEWNGGWEPKGWGDLPYEVGSNFEMVFDEALLATENSPFLLYVKNHQPNMTLACRWFNRGFPDFCSFEILLLHTFGA